MFTACPNVAPRSGFLVERYRRHQLVSTLSAIRSVSRPLFLAPVALLDGSLRKRSRLTVGAPFDLRNAFRNASWLSSSSVLSAMYWGMSASRFDSAALYAVLPPLTPPSSLYCSHRSLSMISAAHRK